MLITFCSYILISFFAINIGITLKYIFEKFFVLEVNRLDTYIIIGMMGLTVYAGLFSLFYKVGFLANLILLFVSVFVLFTKAGRNQWKSLLSHFTYNGDDKKIFLIRVVISSVILLTSLFVGSIVESFYDTELYHGQAIRWIEEYGTVKGLGILHSRFSYNSCFMPLQALFGYKWLFGTELHSLNTYLAFVLSMWAIHTQDFFYKRSFSPASGLKCVLLIFTWIFELSALSSPNSDYFALTMSIYIIANLCEAVAKELASNDAKALNNDSLTGQFILYSFFAVYAISLKLSVALIVLIAIYPAFALIRKGNWKTIIFAILTGIVIISPYLLRNILISGYLVYPYTQIDIFDVTWKVTKELADYDRQEIMVWGRSLNDTLLYDYKLSQWLPIWWGNVAHIYRRILEVAFILIFAAFIKCCIYLLSGKKTARGNLMVLLYADSAAMLLMWFLAAPLLRYGMVFALMIPGIYIGDIISHTTGSPFESITDRKVYKKISSVLGYAGPILSMVAALCFFIYFAKDQNLNIISPAPYQMIEDNSKEVEGVTIYYAREGTDWVGYHNFPAIPYEPFEDSLGIVDPTDLSKGFWNKEVYYSMDSTEKKPIIVEE